MDAQKVFIWENIRCPKCGGIRFFKDNKKQTRYFCSMPAPNGYCGAEVYMCTRCNKPYLKDNYGYRNEAYECKECGQVQWELTEKQRFLNSIKAERNRIKDLMSGID